MPQFKLDLWARIGLLCKQSFGKFIPLNRSHSKKGLVSQFTNTSSLQQCSEHHRNRRHEINDSTPKVKEKPRITDTQQCHCCDLYVPETHDYSSLKKATAYFQELSYTRLSGVSVAQPDSHPQGQTQHHVCLLALAHNQGTWSCLSAPMSTLPTFVLYIQMPNEPSRCAWVLLEGHSTQTLAAGSHSSPEHSSAVPRNNSREQSRPVEHVQLPAQPGSAGRDSPNKALDKGELRDMMWHQDDTQVSVLKEIGRQ